MLTHRKTKHQTFPDGWGTSWEVEDRVLIAKKQECIHFASQTVGERRFWDAQAQGTVIKAAVKVPYDSRVEQGDVFVIEGKQYEVVQKDLKTDKMPQSWLLSLASAEIAYREAK